MKLHTNIQNFKTLIAFSSAHFDTSDGWQTKTVSESPLMTDFRTLWRS